MVLPGGFAVLRVADRSIAHGGLFWRKLHMPKAPLSRESALACCGVSPLTPSSPLLSIPSHNQPCRHQAATKRETTKEHCGLLLKVKYRVTRMMGTTVSTLFNRRVKV